MSWAKFDDRYATHPKLIAAGLEARGLDAAGICWSAGQETDGFVPDAIVLILGAGSVKPHRIAQRLVAVGRWTRDDERKGYWIHDFLDYNRSHAEADKGREADRARKASARTQAGRRKNGRFVSERTPTGTDVGHPPDARGTPTGTPKDSDENPDRFHRIPTRPDPIPSPTSPNGSEVVRPDSGVADAPPETESDLQQPGGQGTGSRQLGDDRGGESVTDDPVSERFVTLWPKQPIVRARARAAVAELRRTYDDALIDEAVGYLLSMDTPVRSPQLLVTTVTTWADQRGAGVQR